MSANKLKRGNADRVIFTGKIYDVTRARTRKPDIAHFDHPCVLLVDMPGFDESAVTMSELLSQAERVPISSCGSPPIHPPRMSDFASTFDGGPIQTTALPTPCAPSGSRSIPNSAVDHRPVAPDGVECLSARQCCGGAMMARPINRRRRAAARFLRADGARRQRPSATPQRQQRPSAPRQEDNRRRRWRASRCR